VYNVIGIQTMRLVSPTLEAAVSSDLASIGARLQHATRRLAVVNDHGVLPLNYSLRDIFLDGTLEARKSSGQQTPTSEGPLNVVHPEDSRLSKQGHIASFERRAGDLRRRSVTI